MAICYRNMTFCREETCGRFGGDCTRSLTSEVRQAAALWWSDAEGNEEAPVAVFGSRPDCYIKNEIIK
jgi:hypothetical protein